MSNTVIARKLRRAAVGPSLQPGMGHGVDARGLEGGGTDGRGTGGGDGAGVAPFAPVMEAALRAWRLALARAARDQMKMTIGFSGASLREASLTEVLETPMQRAMTLMLHGPGDAMGLMVLSGQMLAAMIEMLTLMRLAPHTPDPGDLRKPTRTDAAMVVEFVDAALAGLDANLGALGGARSFRYAAFIDDPRPLHLMMEDGDYQVFTCDLVLEDGSRSGSMTLALPVPRPDAARSDLAAADATPDVAPQVQGDDSFTSDLAATVRDLPVCLDAALIQLSLTIERVMHLQVGEVVPLPLANLDQITVMGLQGQCVARARLGQNRGLRALRLTDLAKAPMVDPALAQGGDAVQPGPSTYLDIAPAAANGAPVGLAGAPHMGSDMGNTMGGDFAVAIARTA
jgi:flagellar motor switch protein FliM